MSKQDELRNRLIGVMPAGSPYWVVFDVAQRLIDGPLADLIEHDARQQFALREVALVIRRGCPLWSADPANYCKADRVHGEWTRQFVDDVHEIVYPFAPDLLAAP